MTAPKSISYRYLQIALKELRSQGYKIDCKLNGKKDALWLEYLRVTGKEPTQEQRQEASQKAERAAKRAANKAKKEAKQAEIAEAIRNGKKYREEYERLREEEERERQETRRRIHELYEQLKAQLATEEEEPMTHESVYTKATARGFCETEAKNIADYITSNANSNDARVKKVRATMLTRIAS